MSAMMGAQTMRSTSGNPPFSARRAGRHRTCGRQILTCETPLCTARFPPKAPAMSEPEAFWLAMFHARTMEVWAGIAAGCIYVYSKSPLPTKAGRMGEASVSGLLAFSSGAYVAQWAGVHESVAVILLSSLGYLILDVARSVVADRDVLKGIIIKRLGGKKDG